MANYSNPDSSNIVINLNGLEEIKKVREWKSKLRTIGTSYKSRLLSLITEDLKTMGDK